MRLGGIILDASGAVIEFNRVAQSVVQIGSDVNGHASTDSVRAGLKHLLRKGETRFSHNESPWILAPRDGKRPIAVYAMPAGDEEDPHSLTVVVLLDLDEAPEPTLTTLQRMFGLTR